ncbi:MAG: nickel-binding protein [Thermodesulfobacteriota bacterium]
MLWRFYCEYDAPNAEMVQEHTRRTGLPADKISEVSLEINPDMFR